MFGSRRSRATRIHIDYRLPVTVIRFTGTVTTTIDSLLPADTQKKTVRAGSAIVDVRADPRTGCAVEVRESDVDKLKTSFTLLDDGRLVGTEAALDARQDERLRAIVSMASTAGAAALSFGAAPVGAALVAAAAGASTWSALQADFALFGSSRILDLTPEEAVGQERERPEEPTEPVEPGPPLPSELGIHDGFKSAMPADHERLYRYRLALLRLTLAHADAAANATRQIPEARLVLRNLDRVLASTREEAQRAEQIYQAWLESTRSTTVERQDWRLTIDQLPTTEEFERELGERLMEHEDVKHWWKVATTIGVMMTCDLQEEPVSTQPTKADGRLATCFDDGTILFRPPLPAVLTTWRLEQASLVGRWKATREQTEWGLVTHPGNTRSIQVPLASASDKSTKIGFSETGALTALTSEVSGHLGERAETISGLPAAVRDAGKVGSELASTFSPAAARVAGLEQQIAELEKRNKLQGLLNPATDNLADLKRELAEAELEARLSVAHQMRQDPSSVAVTISPKE